MRPFTFQIILAIVLLGCGPGGAGSTSPDHQSARPTTPAGWATLELPGTGLTFAVPPGWQGQSLKAVEAQLEQGIATGAGTGQIADDWTFVLNEIAAGRLISVVVGTSSIAGFTDSIIAFVIDPPTDLRSGVSTAVAAPIFSNVKRELDLDVALPLGDAVLMTMSSEPVGGSPSQSVNYFVLLADGRMLWLNAAAPKSESAFPDLMAAVAESLRAK